MRHLVFAAALAGLTAVVASSAGASSTHVGNGIVGDIVEKRSVRVCNGGLCRTIVYGEGGVESVGPLTPQ